MTLRFGILGPLTVEARTGSIEIGGPKQRAVLAMLIINANRAVAPDRLIDALWGEQPPARATATLQAYISNLRRVLEPARPSRTPAELILRDGAGYRLFVEPEQVDACRFERIVQEAAELGDADVARACELLEEGLRLWRGPALADFRYDEFAQSEILRLEELRASAEERRIALELAMGRSSELVPHLEALVAAYPLRERLWEHLMLALYRSGRPAEAVRTYRRLEAVLADVGMTPEASVRDLELAILNRDPRLIAPTGVSQSTRLRPHLVGRSIELRRFAQAIEEAQQGFGSVLIVDGEPGIGKTSLLETFAADASRAGFATTFARCVEIGGTPPFWPWSQVMAQLGSVTLAEAAGAYAGYLTPLTPGAEPILLGERLPAFRVADGLVAAFRSFAARTPLAVFVDDLYTADADSVAVFALLASQIQTVPLVMVGSHRSRVGPTPPFADTISHLMRFEWVERVSLRRLRADEVSELVADVAGASVERAAVAAIHDRTEGNPFFTIELTRLLANEGGLDLEYATAALPSTVVDVIALRLSALSEPALALVRAAAVVGREFEVTVAAESLGFDLETSLDTIDELVESGLVAEADPTGVFRFSHLIVVNTILQELGCMRRAHLHAKVADALERRFSGDCSRWVEIAHHRAHAVPVEGTESAVAALARAAAYARDSHALELAEDLLQRRNAMVAGRPEPARREEARRRQAGPVPSPVPDAGPRSPSTVESAASYSSRSSPM